jgi:diguanylate cyclase (GGDEF)-like protein
VVTPVLVTHYGVADGLIGEDCDTNAFFAEPDGGVFVGTSAGLSYFRGDRPDPVPQPPLTRIVAASLGGRRLAPSITTTRVPFAANTFEVRFAGLSFLSEESVEHEVRMIGLEPAWRRTITREARYAALAAGTYRFEVRARIGHGQWSEPARVAFEVLPPWWQSSPSRLGFTAVALGGVGAALLTWRARWRRRQRELEALVAVRTRERAEANQTLESLSVTDPLTGLKNRRYLSLVLPRDIAHITRVYRNVLEGKAERLTINTDIVFLMVDLDHFKAVNDLHGHGAGDHVLNTIPEILGRVTRQSDTVVRWGGEEFLVVARNANRHEAQTMAERIKNAVGKHTFDVGGGTTVRLTCSVGYAVYPLLDASPDALSWQQTIEIADHCMYAAKRSGRNAWVGVVGQAPSPARSLEALLPGALAEAAKAGELVVATSLAGPAAIVWEQSAQ